MAKRKNDSSSSIVILVLVFAVVALMFVLVYQLNNSKAQSQFGTKTNAALPCPDYSNLVPVTTGAGTVNNKTANGFDWWGNGQSSKVKVVLVCDGTIYKGQFGVNLAYIQVGTGDRVSVMGYYSDNTNTTVYATLVTDMSVSLAGVYDTTVKSVDLNGTLYLKKRNIFHDGKIGNFELIVTHDLNTQCGTSTLNRPFDCSSIVSKVVSGDKVVVSGLINDTALVIAARTIVVNPVAVPNVTLPPPRW